MQRAACAQHAARTCSGCPSPTNCSAMCRNARPAVSCSCAIIAKSGKGTDARGGSADERELSVGGAKPAVAVSGPRREREAPPDTSSCTSAQSRMSACCISGTPFSGTPAGKVETIAGLKCYVARPAQPTTKALILMTGACVRVGGRPRSLNRPPGEL